MWRSFVLRVTGLLAMVNTTVHGTIAWQSTVEAASPSIAILLLVPLSAQDCLFSLPAVAFGVYSDFTRATQAFMTRSGTCVFAAGHNVSTNCIAAPPCLIFCVNAPPCRGFLPAKTALLWTDGRTGWAWPSMTNQIAWMWTLSWKTAVSATRLTT